MQKHFQMEEKERIKYWQHRHVWCHQYLNASLKGCLNSQIMSDLNDKSSFWNFRTASTNKQNCLFQERRNDVSNLRKCSAPPTLTPPASHPIIMMNLLSGFCHFLDFAIYHTLVLVSSELRLLFTLLILAVLLWRLMNENIFRLLHLNMHICAVFPPDIEHLLLFKIRSYNI